MKKTISAFCIILLSLMMCTIALADAPVVEYPPDYKTDYYMIVECADGGIDLYADADSSSTKLNEEQIPNGTALYIEGEKAGSDKKDWGYVNYQGEQGYVSLDDLKPSTRSEAVQAEKNIHGWKAADYDLQVNGKDGSVPLYYGPGQKYHENTAIGTIANGETLHISQETADEDGKGWGLTEVAGTEVWVNLEEAQWDSQEENSVDAISDGVQMAESTPTAEKTSGVDAIPEADLTPAAEAASSVEITPGDVVTPTAAPTATAEAPTAAETPTTATPTAAETPTAKETAAATVTAAAVTTAATPEVMEKNGDEEVIATVTSEADKKGSVQAAADSWTANPALWAGVAAALILILLIIYFIRKKSSK